MPHLMLPAELVSRKAAITENGPEFLLRPSRFSAQKTGDGIHCLEFWESAAAESSLISVLTPHPRLTPSPLHEPERAIVDFQALTQFRFMVPMRGKKTVEAP